MTVKCFLIPEDEFSRREDERRAKLLEIQRKNQGVDWRELCKLDEAQQYFHPRFYGPGAMWYCPWYWDPRQQRDEGMRTLLSDYYWQDWAAKRSPIMVITPSGAEWCVDQKAQNGKGWRVTGEAPNLTCTPSILVPGYHGYLRNGEFTDDVDKPRVRAVK